MFLWLARPSAWVTAFDFGGWKNQKKPLLIFMDERSVFIIVIMGKRVKYWF
jgi:hypothetical protein